MKTEASKPSIAPYHAATKRARIATALAWIGLALALACGAAELLAGPGYRLGWWQLGAGFQIMRWAATADIAAAVISLGAIAVAARGGARRALTVAAAGLVLSLLVVAPPLFLLREARRLPDIHDISTDTENPPRFVALVPLRSGARNTTDYSAEVAALQRTGYPDIAPALLDGTPAEALRRAERAARAMGWEIVAVAPEDFRIEAIATTLLFGFKDDIVIRVTPNGRGSRVDMRSLSRVGSSDIGVNAKRIRSFMKELAS